MTRIVFSGSGCHPVAAGDCEISTAVGLLMERHAQSAEQAFEMLGKQARLQRKKVLDVARALLAGEKQAGS